MGQLKTFQAIPRNESTAHLMDVLTPKTMAALERLLTGETIVKVKKQDLIRKGRLTGHQKTTTTRTQVLPNVAAVIFVMERAFPERFGKMALQRVEIHSNIELTPQRHPAIFDALANTAQTPKEPSEWQVFVSPPIKTLQNRERHFTASAIKALQNG